jgi:hypothetical protein
MLVRCVVLLMCIHVGDGLAAQFVDVCVCPSALHIELVKSSLRSEVKIAIQDIHTAKVGLRMIVWYSFV